MAEESSPQLPASLRPALDREPSHTPIIASDVGTVIPSEALPELAEELKLIGFDSNLMRQLANCGIKLEGVGMVQVANAYHYLTLQAGLSCIAKIKTAIDNGNAEDAAKFADPLSKIMGKVNTLANSLKDRTPTSAKAAPGPNRTPSFPSDAPINVEKAIINVQNP